MNSKPLSFGPFTLKELAAMYRKDMHTETFERMIGKVLKQFGKPEGNYYYPEIVKAIFKQLGPPDCFYIEYQKLKKEGLID
jgi:hypothetical protein